MQEQLLGHLLGALEDSEEEEISALLQTDPQLRRQLAVLRLQLKPLEAGRRQFDPPAGLAERTCRFVSFRAKSRPSTRQRPRPMGTQTAPPGWIGSVRWIDVAVAAGIFAAACLLLFPALQQSRFQSRLRLCQGNLREIGLAMKQYSRQNGGYFPKIPTHGKLSSAGIFGPILVGDNLLPDVRRLLCPDSSLAGYRRFRVPLPDEIDAASEDKLKQFRVIMGGSYGNNLGYVIAGVYHATKDQNRRTFALLSDAPSPNLPGYQTENHGGKGQNVLFEDLHVQFLLRPKLHDQGDYFFSNDRGVIAAGLHPDDSSIGPSWVQPLPAALIGSP